MKYLLILLFLLPMFTFGAVHVHSDKSGKFHQATQLDMELGASDGYIVINKYGRNPDVDTGTVPEDLWDGGGTYTGFPTGAGETVEVVSTDTQDTNTTGTGCWTFILYGMDTNKKLQEETINLDGTNGATSTKTFTRVYRGICLTAGSGDTNAGTLTVRHSTTTANIFTVIAPAIGQSRVAGMTVPLGYTGYVVSSTTAMLDAGSTRVNIDVKVKQNGFATKHIRPFSITPDRAAQFREYGGVKMPARTDFISRITSVTSNNADITQNFVIVLVPDL